MAAGGGAKNPLFAAGDERNAGTPALTGGGTPASQNKIAAATRRYRRVAASFFGTGACAGRA